MRRAAARRRRDRQRRGAPEARAIIAESPTSCPPSRSSRSSSVCRKPRPRGSRPSSGRAAAARATPGAPRRRSAAYRGALALRADWDEGWWYLGALLYESKRCAEANAAFERFLALKPEAGPGWVMRGVCAFELRRLRLRHRLARQGHGPRPRRQRGAAAGRAQPPGVRARDHRPVRARHPVPDRAGAPGPGHPGPRRGDRPRPPPPPAPAVRGPRRPARPRGEARARGARPPRPGAARRRRGATRSVVAAYPDEPWVRYAHGVFLLRSGDEKGLDELRRAVQLKPDNVTAHLEIAFELLDPPGLRGGAGVRDEGRRARPDALRRRTTPWGGRWSSSGSSTPASASSRRRRGSPPRATRRTSPSRAPTPGPGATRTPLASGPLFTELEERQRASPDRAAGTEPPRP